MDRWPYITLVNSSSQFPTWLFHISFLRPSMSSFFLREQKQSHEMPLYFTHLSAPLSIHCIFLPIFWSKVFPFAHWISCLSKSCHCNCSSSFSFVISFPHILAHSIQHLKYCISCLVKSLCGPYRLLQLLFYSSISPYSDLLWRVLHSCYIHSFYHPHSSLIQLDHSWTSPFGCVINISNLTCL